MFPGASLIVLIAMHLLGSRVAGRADGIDSDTRAISWPMWQVLKLDRFPAPQMLRIALAVVAIV